MEAARRPDERHAQIAPDTIFALASGAPPAAIAVVRISGPGAEGAVRTLAGALPPPRHASLRTLHAADGDRLDRALVLWFPAPASATGEDVGELHLHGGRAVVDGVLRALAAVPGLRPARPGEFTRRAWESGAIDLVEAEGLADLVEAETDAQRRAALLVAGGTLSRRVEGWRVRLLGIAAQVEALLDFAEEEDVAGQGAWPRADAAALRIEIERALAVPPAERLRDGVRVVLAGPPNAGKSTLLNALVGREAAIATPVPGTTRDVIEVPVAIGGTAFVLVDTAGLRDTEDAIEAIGVARAEAAVADAQILLWLGDAESAPTRSVLLHARADARRDRGRGLRVSALTGEGLDALRALLVDRAAGLLPREGDVALNRRQASALEEAAAALRRGNAISDLLLVGEELRIARLALDRVTGRADVEAMLDALFGRFCLGK